MIVPGRVTASTAAVILALIGAGVFTAGWAERWETGRLRAAGSFVSAQFRGKKCGVFSKTPHFSGFSRRWADAQGSGASEWKRTDCLLRMQTPSPVMGCRNSSLPAQSC